MSSLGSCVVAAYIPGPEKYNPWTKFYALKVATAVFKFPSYCFHCFSDADATSRYTRPPFTATALMLRVPTCGRGGSISDNVLPNQAMP